jgi:hypothetical protein
MLKTPLRTARRWSRNSLWRVVPIVGALLSLVLAGGAAGHWH